MPLTPAEREAVRGRRILMLLAPRGIVAQEALKPIDLLERYGCSVTLATPTGGAVYFDPLCNVFGALEALWDPTIRLLARARRAGRLSDLTSLDRLSASGQLDAWLDGFDAVMVPGGHGAVFASAILSQRIVDIVARFYHSGRVTALLCHAPYVGALSSAAGDGFIAGKTVACWPRRFERATSYLPLIGGYSMPFGRPVGHLMEEAGATVHDSLVPGRAVHAVVDDHLVTGRGPWSTTAFTTALLQVLAAHATPATGATAGSGIPAPLAVPAG